MNKLLLVLLLSGCQAAVAQPVYDLRLKAELDSMYKTDQACRENFSYLFTQQGRDSIAAILGVPSDHVQEYVIRKMNRTDSLNMARLVQIIELYGYPGKKLVGTPTNEAAFFILQHSTQIDQYIPLVKQAAKQKELAFPLYAMMLDRSRMYHDKKQVYGTQVRGFEMSDPATGKKEWKMLVWPIQRPRCVNRRRRKAGFPISAEENAKRLGVNYQVYKLKEVRKMMGK